jgi:hypothetical protein
MTMNHFMTAAEIENRERNSIALLLKLRGWKPVAKPSSHVGEEYWKGNVLLNVLYRPGVAGAGSLAVIVGTTRYTGAFLAVYSEIQEVL